MRIRLGLLLALGVVLLTGCVGTASEFSDDFSDPSSGWGASSHETYVRGYQQGRYLMQIDVPQWLVWATAGGAYTDVEIEAVVRSEQVTDNHYGVICRYTEGQFYYFAISTDGYYAIFRRSEEGELIPLTGQAMLRSPLIRIDGTDNRILAVCQESELALFINGEQAVRVSDDVLAKGDVGMAAGTLGKGGTIVWFDDLEVRKP